MKVGEIIRIIEKGGWYRTPAKGGHRQYKHSVKARPRDRARQAEQGTAAKTEKSILRQAGLAVV